MLGRFLSLFGLWPFGQKAGNAPPTPTVPLGHGVCLTTQLVQPTEISTQLVQPTEVTTQLVGAGC